MYGKPPSRPMPSQLEEAMRTIPLSAAFACLASLAAAETPVLDVYTYDSAAISHCLTVDMCSQWSYNQ